MGPGSRDDELLWLSPLPPRDALLALAEPVVLRTLPGSLGGKVGSGYLEAP